MGQQGLDIQFEPRKNRIHDQPIAVLADVKYQEPADQIGVSEVLLHIQKVLPLSSFGNVEPDKGFDTQ
jgi:hypothetical protein